MKYKKVEDKYVVRLDRGEALMDCLMELIASENITAAWVSGLGGATKVTLGFYDIAAGQYNWQEFTELIEITSLQGNIAVDEENKPIIHLHGSFSRADFSAIGGHIKALEVGATCELFVTEVPLSLVRRQQENVSLKLLDL